MAPPKRSRSRSSSPMTAQTRLWRDAYKAIKADPDESSVIADFHKVLLKDQVSVAHFDSETGRKQLSNFIDLKSGTMQSSSSPDITRALNIVNKVRNTVVMGSAANPCATVAVAGLFAAFDLIAMHQAEKEAIFQITLDSADIMCRSTISDHQVNRKHDNEPPELVDNRERLAAAYVQLYRKILYLSMKIAYKLTGWKKWLIGWSDWSGDQQSLEKAENRVNKFLRQINDYELNPPAAAAGIASLTLQPPPPSTSPVSSVSNWKSATDKQETQLHRLVRLGRTDDVYRLIETGQCPRELLNAKTSKGWTALMLAVTEGHWVIMTYLLETDGIWVNARNKDGNTALILAAQRNRPFFTRKLLLSGAKPDVRNSYQRTAFLEAAMKGNLAAMQVLVEHGHDDVNQVTGVNGWCVLHTAIERNDVDMAKWLLIELGGKGSAGAAATVRRDIKIKGGKYMGLTPEMMARQLNRTDIVALMEASQKDSNKKKQPPPQQPKQQPQQPKQQPQQPKQQPQQPKQQQTQPPQQQKQEQQKQRPSLSNASAAGGGPKTDPAKQPQQHRPSFSNASAAGGDPKTDSTKQPQQQKQQQQQQQQPKKKSV